MLRLRDPILWFFDWIKFMGNGPDEGTPDSMAAALADIKAGNAAIVKAMNSACGPAQPPSRGSQQPPDRLGGLIHAHLTQSRVRAIVAMYAPGSVFDC